MTTFDDLVGLHGQSVSCTINGYDIQDAKISVDTKASRRREIVTKIYICHNQEGCFGPAAADMLGYEYSWYVTASDSNKPNVSSSDVTNLHLKKLNEAQNKLAKLFKQGKTHKFIFSKGAGEQALRTAELERIEKSLNLAIDRDLDIERGWSYEKGRKLFNVKPMLDSYHDETGEVKIWSNFGVRDGDMDKLITTTLTKLGYELQSNEGVYRTRLHHDVVVDKSDRW